MSEEPMREDIRSRCPEGEIIYDPRLGAKICKETGEVIEELVIGDEPEVKSYTPEEKLQRERYGSPLSYSKLNLVSRPEIVAPTEPGPKLKTQRKPDYLRSAVRATKAMTTQEKNLRLALNMIEDLAQRLELSHLIKEEAAKLYREAVEKGLARGRSVDNMVAAVVYLACRLHRTPYSLDEIIENMKNLTEDSKRDVARIYRLLIRELGRKVPVLEPTSFVYRITSSLNLPDKVAVEAVKILMEAKRRGLTAGKDPSGLAAAAVYIAALKHGIRRTQKDVAKVANVTEVTVRNRYKELTKILGIIEEELA